MTLSRGLTDLEQGTIMDDNEIDRLIREIKEMARRIGCEFVPDPRKLADFRKSQELRREYVEQYRCALSHS